jgi:hypothetical protein
MACSCFCHPANTPGGITIVIGNWPGTLPAIADCKSGDELQLGAKMAGAAVGMPTQPCRPPGKLSGGSKLVAVTGLATPIRTRPMAYSYLHRMRNHDYQNATDEVAMRNTVLFPESDFNIDKL